MPVPENDKLLQVLRDARAQIEAAASTDGHRREQVGRAIAELDAAADRVRDGGRASSAPDPSKKDLLSVICHDLKDPLASIVMGAGFLKKVIPDDQNFSSARRIVDAIARSSERMNGVIGDFYDLGKLEAGQLAVDKKPVDAAALARAAVDVSTAKVKDKGLELIADIALAEGQMFVVCDRARILQVFAKLVHNATKFSAQGATITIAAHAKDDGVEMSVIDSGRGIAEERRPTVFDREANWKAVPRDGPGLGLAIAKGLVELNGGRIGVDSKLGEGTRAWFWLPRAVG